MLRITGLRLLNVAAESIARLFGKRPEDRPGPGRQPSGYEFIRTGPGPSRNATGGANSWPETYGQDEYLIRPIWDHILAKPWTGIPADAYAGYAGPRGGMPYQDRPWPK